MWILTVLWELNGKKHGKALLCQRPSTWCVTSLKWSVGRSVMSALFNPTDCSPQGSSVHGDSPGKNAGVGGHALLQGIFPPQGSNLGLLNSRQILYQLSYQGSLVISPSSYFSVSSLGHLMLAVSGTCLLVAGNGDTYGICWLPLWQA